jgi:hypothetical protein
MGYGGKGGGWKGFGRSTDQTFAKHAIAVHICRGCGLWTTGAKPSACSICGRMDFDDFPSKGEAKAWARLLQREKIGEIAELERQVRIPLLTVHHRTGKPVEWAVYVADFKWLDVASGDRVLAECKPGGRMTYESALKIRCVEAMGIPVTMLT